MDRRWDKSKPPQGPFALNRDCPQAQGLVAWWPMGGAGGAMLAADYAGTYHGIPGTAGGITLMQDGRPGLSLTAASNQYLGSATTPVTGWPMSLSAWFQTDGSTQTAIQVVATSADINHFGRIVLVTNKVRANCGGALGQQASAITTASYTNGKLHLAGATFTSNTSRTAYLDGANAVSETTSITTNIAFSRIRLGVALTTSDALLQPLNGILGETGLWDIALDAAAHFRLYDPSTRFELWYPLRSRKWFALVGGTYSATQSESPSLADSYATALSTASTLAESAATSDAITVALAAVAALADSLGSTDAAVAALTAAVAASEAASASDTVSTGSQITGAVSEAATLADVQTAAALLVRLLTEPAAAADSVSAGSAAYSVSVSELAAALDILASTLDLAGADLLRAPSGLVIASPPRQVLFTLGRVRRRIGHTLIPTE